MFTTMWVIGVQAKIYYVYSTSVPKAGARMFAPMSPIQLWLRLSEVTLWLTCNITILCLIRVSLQKWQTNYVFYVWACLSIRLFFPTFGLKIFTRINNQISKIILSEQIFNLKSESDLRFCISLDSDSCNNRISIKSELSQDFEIK